MEILLAVLGGSAVAAFINQVGEYIRARKSHEEKTETKRCLTDVQVNLQTLTLLCIV